MRRVLAGLLAVIFSFSVMAVPLDPSQLDRVNDFIADLVADQAGDFATEVVLTEVRLDPVSGLPRAATMRATALGDLFTAFAGVEIEEGVVTTEYRLEGYLGALGLTQDMILGSMGMIQDMVDDINDTGDFFAALNIQTTRQGTSATVTIEPMTPSDDDIVRSVILNGFIPNDLDGELSTFSLVGEFNAEDQLIVVIQQSLGNILNDLLDGVEPSPNDIDKLIEIVSDLISQWF